MMQLIFNGNEVWAEDPEAMDRFIKNYIGQKRGSRVFLHPEEALYAMAFMNAGCVDAKGKPATFTTLASAFSVHEPRLFVRYNAVRDWRDRGLIVRRLADDKMKSGGQAGLKKYPPGKIAKTTVSATLLWHNGFSTLEDETIGRELFQTYWLGQLGVYKQTRGSILALDFMETIFAGKHLGLLIVDAATGKKLAAETILKTAEKEREYARQLYEVYEDWRLNGYIVKTGFKFGTHFRIYFPGASPANRDDEWIHSKHVLHVFPKGQKMVISEWARAVRVAHGVKKTFILSIPEFTKDDVADYPADYVAYRRKSEGGNLVRETPDDKPRYLLVPVAEDESIGGIELASLLEKAKKLGLEVLLSITDRETAITYYVLKKIQLPGAAHEYYEIEWMKP